MTESETQALTIGLLMGGYLLHLRSKIAESDDEVTVDQMLDIANAEHHLQRFLSWVKAEQ